MEWYPQHDTGDICVMERGLAQKAIKLCVQTHRIKIQQQRIHKELGCCTVILCISEELLFDHLVNIDTGTKKFEQKQTLVFITHSTTEALHNLF